jgi:hypothetical protein
MLDNSANSFCKKDIMCVCTAESNERQRECRYYEKAGTAERCMYFVFDEYCDSLKAQTNA